MPLSDVRPGMVGQALTVFQGTKPEPFKVRVVSVMRNFLPKQDVILIRAEDPRVEFSGIVAGMSGSPVYIDGKLVGAVAYAWSFAKEPLGGVTPIESMLAERRRPRRVSREYFAGGSGRRPAAAREPARLRVRTTRSARPTRCRADWGCPPMGPAPAMGEPRLMRASVPLSVSGFAPRTVARAGGRAAPDRVWCRCKRAAAAAPDRRPPATSRPAPPSASSWFAAT